MKTLLSLCLALILLLVSCKGREYNEKMDNGDITYAELLEIDRREGYVEVKVKSASDGSAIATYILVPRENRLPDKIPVGEIIRIPVRSLIVNSSVYASPLQELNRIDVIKGVTDASYFAMPEIQHRLKSGIIEDVGSSQSPSAEKIINMHPDGILVNIYEGMEINAMPTTGISNIKFADNLESTPLGRAEWIKFLGLLTGTENKADSIFNKVAKEYNALKYKLKSSEKIPKVLTDNMYEGIWYVPGGRSASAVIIKDAGGFYPWENNQKNGSLALSYEEILDKAADADVWIMKGFGPMSYSSLFSADERYCQFKAFKERKIWYSDTSVSQLFDKVAFHPEQLLADYIDIIHPKDEGDNHLRFFYKIK